MSILFGYEKEKHYRNDENGDKILVSQWTNTSTIDVSTEITSQEKTLAEATSWVDTWDEDITLPTSLDRLIVKLTGEFTNIKYLKNCIDNMSINIGVVSKTKNGLCPKLPNETTTTKFLRQDGSWKVPPNTTYSQATSSTLGLVRIGYSASGKNYAVKLNGNGQMYVNVPWTDTNTVTEVVNNVTSTSTSKALSANQGRLLNNAITTLSSKVSGAVKGGTIVKTIQPNDYENVKCFYSGAGGKTADLFYGDYPFLTDADLRSRMGIGNTGTITLYVCNGDANAQPNARVVDAHLKNGTWYVCILGDKGTKPTGSFRFNWMAIQY